MTQPTTSPSWQAQQALASPDRKFRVLDGRLRALMGGEAIVTAAQLQGRGQNLPILERHGWVVPLEPEPEPHVEMSPDDSPVVAMAAAAHGSAKKPLKRK